MPQHAEKSPSALAHGPAKADDIERARRDLGAAKARAKRALLAERRYLSELQRTGRVAPPRRGASGRLSRGRSAPAERGT
jgi:hypothetical protein